MYHFGAVKLEIARFRLGLYAGIAKSVYFCPEAAINHLTPDILSAIVGLRLTTAEAMQFDHTSFLRTELKSERAVTGLFAAYGVNAPPGHEAVSKWFQRGRVPSEWLPIILAILEIEGGRPVCLSDYIK